MSDLASYAARKENSKGRLFKESRPQHRNEYQRDRDRIIHSSAFRRLEYKTQVFVNHEGDMFRTRLTHSIEVAQIGRTIARAMQLNEDLTEAICLAHDLGHTPFGHAGQDALNLCMKEHGGFEHNLQSLRVVDLLEERYAEFPGLNLLYETREGILKHCSRNNALRLGELGKRFLENKQPGLEAQVANIADEIAYNNHDVDDGLRSGLISISQLSECVLFAEQQTEIKKLWPSLGDRRMIHEIVRRMINSLVTDLIATSEQNLKEKNPADIEAVRNLDGPMIMLSEDIRNKHQELKQFLRKNLYQHERVKQMTDNAKNTVRTLFDAYIQKSKLMPDDFQNRFNDACRESGTSGGARVVADYIAGMTDRYAFAEFEKITNK